MSVTSLVHRPAPRAVVAVAMIFLALIIAPLIIVAPEKLSQPGTLFGLAVWGAFELLLLSIFLRRVDISLEGGEVRLISSRFPFGSREERVAKARVRGVEVETRTSLRGGPAVRLILRLDDESAMPVTQSYFGRSARTDADLTALRQLLGVDPTSPRSS
ncbi:MAG: hypothetical protein QM817_38090 [Archangium sp.]